MMEDEARARERVEQRMITVPVKKVKATSSSPHQDLLAVEEPLEIRLGFHSEGKRKKKSISVTMRTPGDDLALAVGFLFTEGIISSHYQIENIRHLGLNNDNIQESNVVQVELRPDVKVDYNRLERHFYTTSSCGVCGKTSIDALQIIGCPILPEHGTVFDLNTIHRLPKLLLDSQALFGRTGGLHAAALFDLSGKLAGLREDVGRHNAVDKLIGAQFIEKHIPLNNRLLMVSGRASFELVQKALMAGIPILAAVGAPSSLAVELALKFSMTLLGFVRDNRFNIYSGEWRIRTEQ
jgi:FdhD protein